LPPLDRDERAAMAAVASMLPVNAVEGRLAAQFVLADAWAADCLRLAQERQLEFDVARKCRTQAASLMREGKSALRMLLRLQAVREKREADDAAAERAAWVEHAAMEMMAAAPEPASEEPERPVPVAAQEDGSGRSVGKSGPSSKYEKDLRDSRRETALRPMAEVDLRKGPEHRKDGGAPPGSR
jgi:hypothetical protein